MAIPTPVIKGLQEEWWSFDIY